MTEADILTVEQISKILRISCNTIQRKSWQQKTGCPLRQIGRRLYVIAAEFWQWFKKYSKRNILEEQGIEGDLAR